MADATTRRAAQAISDQRFCRECGTFDRDMDGDRLCADCFSSGATDGAPLDPPICPYCERRAELVNGEEIYGRDYGAPFWLCRPCQAWVGTHKNSKSHAPLGRLANAELRYWKQRAHAAFDPLWRRKMKRDQCSKSQARRAAYAWLADELGVGKRRCHIGWMDVDDCKAVVAICRRVRRDPNL